MIVLMLMRSLRAIPHHHQCSMYCLNPVALYVFRLICTDAIARGMDVDNVKYVMSYDATPNVNTYVHRVGRTARAGKTGTALTLVTQQEVSLYRHFVFHVIS